MRDCSLIGAFAAQPRRTQYASKSAKLVNSSSVSHFVAETYPYRPGTTIRTGSNGQLITIPNELPILPIRNIVVFPGTVMPLNVGRQKSKNLLDDVMPANVNTLFSDRHNIRGERISIDTIPLVGEQELAAAVRATARLPRVKMVVLAGSIMGGAITEAVKEVQSYGLRVISLNQAGSVPDAADLVVSDPVQAGVMAVMAVADTAKFDLMKQLKKRY